MSASSGFSFDQFRAASESFVLSGDRQASAFIETLLLSRCHRVRDWYEILCQYKSNNSNNGAGASSSAPPQFSVETVFPHFVDLTAFIGEVMSHAAQQHLSSSSSASGGNGNGNVGPSSSPGGSASASFSPALFTSVLLLKRFSREWLPQFVAYEKRIRYLRGGGGGNDQSKNQQQQSQQGGGGGINFSTAVPSQQQLAMDAAARQQEETLQRLMARHGAPSLIDAAAVPSPFSWILEAANTVNSATHPQGTVIPKIPIPFSSRLLALLLQLRTLVVDVLAAIISKIQSTTLGLDVAASSSSSHQLQDNVPIAVWSRDPVVKMLLHVIGVLEVLLWAEEPTGVGGSDVSRKMMKQSRRLDEHGDDVVGGEAAVRLADICNEVLRADVCAHLSSPNILENVMAHFTTIGPDFYTKLTTSATPFDPSGSGVTSNGSLSHVAAQLVAAANQYEQQQQQQQQQQQYQSQSQQQSAVSNRIIAYYQRLSSMLYVADRLSTLSADALQSQIQQHIAAASSSSSSSSLLSYISAADVGIVGGANIFAIVLYVVRNVVEALVDRRIRIDFMMRAKVRSSMQLGRDTASSSSPSSSSSCMCAALLTFIELGLEQILKNYNGVFSTNPQYGAGGGGGGGFGTIASSIAGTTAAIMTHVGQGSNNNNSESLSSTSPLPMTPLALESGGSFPLSCASLLQTISSPYWPSSLTTALFYLQLATETLTMCMGAAIETASLAGQTGMTSGSGGGGGNSSSSSAAKPTSPWGEAFWLMLHPSDPLGMNNSHHHANNNGVGGHEAHLLATTSIIATTSSGGCTANSVDTKVSQSLLWDFILKSGFVAVDGCDNNAGSSTTSYFRPPLLFTLAAAVKQLSLSLLSAQQQSQHHQSSMMSATSFNNHNNNQCCVCAAGGGGSSGSGISSLVVSQLRILSRYLHPYTENLAAASTATTTAPSGAMVANGGGFGSPQSIGDSSPQNSFSAYPNNASTSSAVGAAAMMNPQNQPQCFSSNTITAQEDCPPMEVAVCDLLVKLFEVIGMEGTCSMGCMVAGGNHGDATTDAATSAAAGGADDGYGDEGYYDDTYASNEFYFDVCAVAAAAITRGLRFVQPPNAVPIATHNQQHIIAPLQLVCGGMNNVSCKPLFLSVFMGISEAAVPLLDATTEKYVASAIEVSCACCCKDPLLQQHFSSPAEMATAIISRGNMSLKHSLFTAFTTTLTHIITDPIAFSVSPPLSTLMRIHQQRQQQQQQQSPGSPTGRTLIHPSIPLSFPMVAMLTQRSQPVTANSNVTTMMMSASSPTASMSSPPTLNAPHASFNGVVPNGASGAVASSPPPMRGSISVVRVLDIRLCAALELISPSLSGLTMICQALAPQSIPAMDEEADDPEDFGFTVVDGIDGENVRKRLTISGLFSSASSLPVPGAGVPHQAAAAEAPLQAPLLLPADSFFIAAATKVASHCLTSYGTALKVELEMGTSHALINAFIHTTNASATTASATSLLLSELLAFLNGADDTTLLYGTDFHESVMHCLSSSSFGGDEGVGNGGGAAASGSGDDDVGGKDDGGSSSGASSADSADTFGSALSGLSSLPLSATLQSQMGAIGAENLLNYQLCYNAMLNARAVGTNLTGGNITPPPPPPPPTAASTAFKNGIIDIHKHSVAAFISSFLHLGALATTSVTTRRSLLLYLVVGAINVARGATGTIAGNSVLAPLTVDQLVVGRNASSAATGNASVSGATYMTAHDDEDTNNSHPQELVAALQQSVANPNLLGTLVTPLVVDPVLNSAEQIVQVLMSLSNNNNNNSGGGGNTTSGNTAGGGGGSGGGQPSSSLSSGGSGGGGAPKSFTPFSTLHSIIVGNLASGISTIEIIAQSAIDSTNMANNHPSALSLGAAAAANGTSGVLTSAPSPTALRNLAQMLQNRTTVCRADMFALLLEAACIPTPFAILRIAARNGGANSSGGATAAPSSTIGGGRCGNNNAAGINATTLSQIRLTTIAADWLCAESAKNSATAENAANTNYWMTNNAVINQVASNSVVEVTKCVADNLADLFIPPPTSAALNGGSGGAAGVGGMDDDAGADETEDNNNAAGNSSSSESSLPFPSLLSMPSIVEVTGWMKRIRALLISLRNDAMNTLPAHFRGLFSLPTTTGGAVTPNTVLVQNSILTRLVLSEYIVLLQTVEIYAHRVWQVVAMMSIRAERCLSGEAVLANNGYNSGAAEGWPQWLQEEYNRSRELLQVVGAFWGWFGQELSDVSCVIGQQILTDETNKAQQEQQHAASGAGASSPSHTIGGPSSANTSAGALHRYRDLLCRLANKAAATANTASEEQLRLHTPTQVKQTLINTQRPQRLQNYFNAVAEASVAYANDPAAASAAASGGSSSNAALSSVTLADGSGLHELAAIIQWSLAKPQLEAVFKSKSFVECICGGSSNNNGMIDGDLALSQMMSTWGVGMTTVPTGCVSHNVTPSSAGGGPNTSIFGNVAAAPAPTTATTRMILSSVNLCLSSALEVAALLRNPTSPSMGHHNGHAAVSPCVNPARANRIAQAALLAIGQALVPAYGAALSGLRQYNGGGAGGGQTPISTASSSPVAVYMPIGTFASALSDAIAITTVSSAKANFATIPLTTSASFNASSLVAMGRQLQQDALSMRNDLLVAVSSAFFSQNALKTLAEMSFNAQMSAMASSSASSLASSAGINVGGGSCGARNFATSDASLNRHQQMTESAARTALITVIEYIAGVMDSSASSPIRFGLSHMNLLTPSIQQLVAMTAGGGGAGNGSDGSAEDEAAFASSESLTNGWVNHISNIYQTYATTILSGVSGASSPSSPPLPSAATLLMLNPSIIRVLLSAAHCRATPIPSLTTMMGGPSSAPPSSSTSSTAYAYLRQIWLPSFESFAAQIGTAAGIATPPPGAPSIPTFMARCELLMSVVKSLQEFVGGGGGSGSSTTVVDRLVEMSVSSATRLASDVVYSGGSNDHYHQQQQPSSSSSPTSKKQQKRMKNQQRATLATVIAASVGRTHPQFVLGKVMPALSWALTSCIGPIEQNLAYMAQVFPANATLASHGGSGGGDEEDFAESLGALRSAIAKTAVETVLALGSLTDFYQKVCSGAQQQQQQQNSNNPSASAAAASGIDLFPIASIVCSPTTINLMKLIGIGGDEEGLGGNVSASSAIPSSEWQLGLLSDQFIGNNPSASSSASSQQQHRFGFVTSSGRSQRTALQMRRDEAWHNLLSLGFTSALVGSAATSSSSSSSVVPAGAPCIGSSLLAVFSNPSAFISANTAANNDFVTPIQSFYKLLSSIIGHGNPNDMLPINTALPQQQQLAVGHVQAHLSYVLNRLRTANDLGEVCGLWQQLCVVVSIIFA